MGYCGIMAIGGAKSFGRCEVSRERRIMKTLIMVAIMAFPLMALGQTAQPQETQGQTKETQATSPAKEKKATVHPAQEQRKPPAKTETGTNVRGQTDVNGRATEAKKNESGARSSTTKTK